MVGDEVLVQYGTVDHFVWCLPFLLFFRPRVAIIGSREQLCIHPEVSKKETNAEKVGGQTTYAPHTALSKCILLLIFVCDFRFTSAVPRFTAVLVSTIQILTVSTQCSLCFFKQFLLLVPTPSQVLYLSRKTYRIAEKFGEH